MSYFLLKASVRADLDWDEEGNLIPQAIYWRDGAIYTVDRVLDARRAPARKAGAVGDQYTIRLSNEAAKVYGKTTCLWHKYLYKRGAVE